MKYNKEKKRNSKTMFIFFITLFFCIFGVNATYNITNSTEVNLLAPNFTKTLVKTIDVDNYLLNHTYEIWAHHYGGGATDHDYWIYTKFYYNDSTNQETSEQFTFNTGNDDTWTTGSVQNPNQRKLVDYVEIYLELSTSSGDEEMKTRNNVLFINPYIYVTANDQTFENNSYFNTTELIFDALVLYSNPNTNLSYSVDGGTLTQFTTNNQEGSFSLSLSEGEHQIYFNAINDEITQTSNNYTFTIDLTSPILYVSLPAEYNYYNDFNLSNYINVSDSNPTTCTVDFIYNNAIENTFNCNDTNTNFSFNGYYILNTTLSDFAGNIVTSSDTILISPYQYFRFNSSLTGNYISDYQVTSGTETFNSVDNYTLIPLYDLGLGTHELQFNKFGYNDETNNVTFNIISAYNETFEIEPVTLSIRAYDAKNTTNQLTFDLIIENSTDTETYTSQLNFEEEYENLPKGDIKMTITSTGYDKAFLYNTLEPYTSILSDVYMYENGTTETILFQVLDFTTNNILEDVKIEAQAVINGSYVSIQQTVTKGTGFAYLELDPDTDYKFIFTKDGYAQSVVNSIPSVTTYNVRLKSDETIFEYLDGISYSFSPQSTLLYENNTYNLGVIISGNSITLSQLKVYVDDVLVDTQSSTNPTGTTFTYPITITTQNTTTLELTYYYNGNTNTISKTYEVSKLSDEEIQSLMNFGDDDGEDARLWKLFIMLIVFAGVMIASVGNATTRDYVTPILLLPTILFIYIHWIGLLYGSVMIIALLAMFVGGNKR